MAAKLTLAYLGFYNYKLGFYFCRRTVDNNKIDRDYNDRISKIDRDNNRINNIDRDSNDRINKINFMDMTTGIILNQKNLATKETQIKDKIFDLLEEGVQEEEG
jgi:hypothetical protein